MATRYRDLVAPSLVDTSVLENGDSEAAAELANAFKQFEGVAANALGGLRSEQGRQEGSEAGARGTPEFRAGLRAQTAYGQAYNNAAMRSYAIKAEADAEDNAARLEVESQNDPEAFAVKFGAFRDETLKQAPKEARGTLSTIYAQRMGTGVARLTRARAIEQNNLARADMQEGVERSIDRIATLSAEDDPVSYEQAAEEEAKLGLMIDGGVNDGTITATEGLALHKKAGREIFSQTVSARFRRVLDSPTGSPVEFIEKLRVENKKNEALSPKEEDELIDTLLKDLSEHNRLMQLGLSEATATMKARYEQGNRDATTELLSGTLSVGTLRRMVQEQRLDPDRATTLAEKLTSGGLAADDPDELFHVRVNLLTFTDEQIADNDKLTKDTRADLILKRQEMASTWKSTQAARWAEETIDSALGIVPGTILASLPESKKRQRDQAKNAWYNEVDALPAAERQAAVRRVANEVIAKYIRSNKLDEAQEARKFRDAYIKANPTEDMDEEEKKAFDAIVGQYNATIIAAEGEAARQ
jgi:hypothetical protein